MMISNFHHKHSITIEPVVYYKMHAIKSNTFLSTLVQNPQQRPTTTTQTVPSQNIGNIVVPTSPPTCPAGFSCADSMGQTNPTPPLNPSSRRTEHRSDNVCLAQMAATHLNTMRFYSHGTQRVNGARGDRMTSIYINTH